MQKTIVAGVMSVLKAVATVHVATQVVGLITTGVSPDEVKTLARS